MRPEIVIKDNKIRLIGAMLKNSERINIDPI